MEEKRPGEYMPVFEDDNGSYIYSAADLCMIEHIGDMLNCGIESLKIEGRMKSPYYVAVTVKAYKEAIERVMQGIEDFADLKEETLSTTHRRQSTGFYYGSPEYIGEVKYKSTADYLGPVAQVDENSGIAMILQYNKFSVGDSCEVLTPTDKLAFCIKWMKDEEGNYIDSAPRPRQKVFLPVPIGVRSGDFVRRWV
jgi:putative protease